MDGVAVPRASYLGVSRQVLPVRHEVAALALLKPDHVRRRAFYGGEVQRRPVAPGVRLEPVAERPPDVEAHYPDRTSGQRSNSSRDTPSDIPEIVPGGTRWARLASLLERGYYTATMIGEREDLLAGRLRSALDGRLEGYVRTDEASRALWSTDASIYLRKPVGVVVARSEGDVRLALGAAAELGLSITPRGTGTSLAGQATAPASRSTSPRCAVPWR